MRKSVPKDVLEKIKAALAAGDESQSQLARRFGISQSYVSRLKPGHERRAYRKAVRPGEAVAEAGGVAVEAEPKPIAAGEIKAGQIVYLTQEPSPRVSTWQPTAARESGDADQEAGERRRESDSAPDFAPAAIDPEEAGTPGPLSMYVARLKVHVEKQEFEPVKRLLADPDLRVLAVALTLADGKQWSAVERIIVEHECGVDRGLSLDSWLTEGLPVRIANYLEGAGFTTFATLAGVPRSRLEAIPNMGPRAIETVIEALRRAVANSERLQTAGARAGEWK